MFKLKDKLTFININQEYLKYLHKHCSEVYYKSIGYDNKPYLGILINEDKNQYVIPISSAKEKHKSWRNTDTDRFLVYENCQKANLSENAVYKENPDGSVKHILSVIDLKKMLPIKEGLYSKVDLRQKMNDSTDVRNYKNLMNKEFTFCVKILPQIISKANKLYDKQMETGRIAKFCSDFKLLESLCFKYKENMSNF